VFTGGDCWACAESLHQVLGVVSRGRWGGEEAAPLPTTTIQLCSALTSAPYSYQTSGGCFLDARPPAGTNMGTETRVQRSRRRILHVRRQQQPSTTTLDDSSSTTTVSRAPHPRLQDHTGSPVETPEVEHVAIPEAVEICEIPEAVELSEISETNEPGGGRHGDFHSHRAAYPRARLFERSALHRPSRIRYRLSDAETSTQDGSTANVTAKAELPPRPKKKGANLSFNDRYGGGSEPDPSHAAAWSSSRSPWSRLTSRNRARVDEAEAEDSEL